ncbi:MAG: alpha/beta fold hydrolase [Rhodothermales bacterium]|nr:alpha/beta fold hydrolase [Rhodothermales bacterium]
MTVVGVVVNSDGWELVGDLMVPESDKAVPLVVLLNKADGDRSAYQRLSQELAARGIASIALDLRGHGESTNLGMFVPGEMQRDPLIWDSEPDVTAALKYASRISDIDSTRIAIVGSSYSGEEMAEAGRQDGYAGAYVALSPGSFSSASILDVDSSNVPWLFVMATEDRFVTDIVDSLRANSSEAEYLMVPGRKHATDILLEHEYVNPMIAEWLGAKLSAP